jgi:cystathionine beta-lyase
MSEPDFALDDDWLRRAGSVKWTFAGPEVLPAWVAEIDVAPCPEVAAALHDAIDRGALGYPAIDPHTALPEATAAFFADRFGWALDPGRVVSTADVMFGIILVLQTLCEPGAVIVPVPAYPPFLRAVPYLRRELVPVPMLEPSGGTGYQLDIGQIDAALAAGARTVLLANPHNPTGRVFTAAELTALRDVVLAHGARVISDEIHAPLVLGGTGYTPYASLDGTAGHVTTLVAASKAWNLAGLKCAQIVLGSAADLRAIRALPPVANHGVSPLGVIATIAAYTQGRDWLDGMVSHLIARRDQLGKLLADHLPQVSWTPPEATYLAWLDVRALDLPDPATTARDRGQVYVNSGITFGAGYAGFTRVNFGTSQERLERVVTALGAGWA